MNYRLEFQRIRSELVERKELLEKELAPLPKGELYCYKSHGCDCYSERFPSKGNAKKETRKGISGNRDIIFKLVRKKYIAKAIPLIDKDLKAIDTLLRRYKPTDENSVMAGFIEKYPELTEGIYYGQMSYADWANQFEPDNSFHKESLKSMSVDGRKKRSLGEVIIASRLDHYGIPFRFEAKINHPDISFVPDFTIIRPRDGKTIYWEHLGMVNDQDYLNYNKSKFDVYERYGIVPWDNLIVSFSQKDYGINEKLIDGLIHGWLL